MWVHRSRRKVRTNAWLLAAVFAMAAACEGGTTQEPPPGADPGGADEVATGALQRAVALSNHYVEALFDGTVPAAAARPESWLITGPGDQTLAVTGARVDKTGRRVILTTDGQRPVLYTLELLPSIAPVAAPEGYGVAQGAAVTGNSTTFDGSTQPEPSLVSAISLSNTSVLLTFSDRMERGTTETVPYYRIVAANAATPREDVGDVDILAAVLSADELHVTLTTTPQEDIEYRVTVTNVIERAGSHLINPTYNKADFFGISPVDTTPPSVTSAVPTSATTILVSFSEPVDDGAPLFDGGAGDPTSYTITYCGVMLDPCPPDAVLELPVVGATLNEFGTQVTLTTLPMVEGVTYDLTVHDVVDKADNPIENGTNTATFTFAGEPQLADGSSFPRVVGAVSTGNTGVLVQFSKPMADSAADTFRYAIVQENVNPEVGALAVLSASFAPGDHKTVHLVTRSQNEVTYTVTVVGVTDLAGNPLAPRITSSGVLVDPTRATFPGTPAGQADAVDSDGDTLSDAVEQRGWVVTVVLGDGTEITREVTSDPTDPDTDGDGLDDAFEMRLTTDPRRADTDGDQLDDNEEWNVLYTDPNSVDSDGDGIHDWDEVEFFKTNATLVDSDGDGYEDGEELFEMFRDPRIADLPEHELSVGSVRLQIDERYTYTDDEGFTRTENSNTATTLTTARSTTHLTEDGWDFNLQGGIADCQSDCEIKKPTDFLTSLFFRAKLEAGFVRHTQTNDESVNASEQAYARSLEKGFELTGSTSVTREVVGARIAVDVTLRNASDVAFTLTNLEVTVQTTDPDDPTRLVPVATLVPEATGATGEIGTYNIGPGQSRGPIVFSNAEVFPNLVEDLMRAPRGLSFKVTNYDLVTADDRNFAYGLQTVRDRTAGVYIDFGDGNPRRYQAITAAVLNRERDDLRCGPAGDQPGEPCVTDADCGTSAPCAGGYIIGGLSEFDGTGRPSGIPLDFVLQDILELRRITPQRVLAGPDGVADTTAAGDDVQVVAPGSGGLAEDDVVVAPGRNGVLDTVPAGDDANPTEPDGVLPGSNGSVQSIAQGDDVQLVPVGTNGVPEDTVIVSAGQNGVLETALRGDDVAAVVTGYEVSRTCNADTPFAILAGTNGVADTTATTGTCVLAFSPHVLGEACTTGLDCGEHPDTDQPGICGADVQQIPAGTSGLATDAVVVGAGATGYVASIPGNDDIYLAPGLPCSADADCAVTGLGAGLCSGPQVVVRVENRRNGQFRRFWAILLSDESQFQTDFGQVMVRAGDTLGLKFIQDIDRDGLSAEEEFLRGSSDFKRDTDGDLLDDFVEVRVGWDVGVVGQLLRRVYPDPRQTDSDRDGLNDREESDFRWLQCSCEPDGPKAVVGNTGNPCSDSGDCAAGDTCRDAVHCSVADYLNGTPCPTCAFDVTLARTDPRRGDTDGDGVTDGEEVFGFLTGAGIVDAGSAEVVIAGVDLTADTVACPTNYCADDPTVHCLSDGDCLGRVCIFPTECDDVQVVPAGTGVTSAQTVVVIPGAYGLYNGTRYTPADADDDEVNGGDSIGSSRAVSDDVPLVGQNEPASETLAGVLHCVDGGSFDAGGLTGLAARFVACAIIKPGANGVIESQPAGDDLLVPEGAGQRRESTDPLSPDTDFDTVADGIERLLGSSPTDPGDTGLAGDRDRDGLTDNQERSGWLVTHYGASGAACASCPRRVYSNPNVADTDLDGLPDYAELHVPCVGNPSAECPLDPTSPDTDGDGISDFDELSADLLARLEQWNGFFPGYVVVASDSEQYGTDPRRQDSDGDGLTDDIELFEGFSVVLEDGSLRTGFSDPADADSDDDGLNDGTEVTQETDPTDPDTDDDQRLDGAEVTAFTDPRVPDVSVTVRVWRIEVDQIEDPGGTENGEFAWWILVRRPQNPGNPVVLTTAQDAGALGHTLYWLNGVPNCWDIELNPDYRHTLHLNKSTTFSLREGESFTIDGLLAEFDEVSSDCGSSPNYIPRYFRSQCYTRFTQTYPYSEVAGGAQGEVIVVNPADSGAQGGDSCSWSVVMAIEVN